MSKTIATNRKAFRDYEILEKFECGIALAGSEVKSIRSGLIRVEDSYAQVEKAEVYLHNLYIGQYKEASYLNVESTRTRKLLLHKHEIEKLGMRMSQRGFALVPLQVYFTERGFVKIQLGLGKGKKLYDKRQDIKRRESDLSIRRLMKGRNK